MRKVHDVLFQLPRYHRRLSIFIISSVMVMRSEKECTVQAQQRLFAESGCRGNLIYYVEECVFKNMFFKFDDCGWRRSQKNIEECFSTDRAVSVGSKKRGQTSAEESLLF